MTPEEQCDARSPQSAAAPLPVLTARESAQGPGDTVLVATLVVLGIKFAAYVFGTAFNVWLSVAGGGLSGSGVALSLTFQVVRAAMFLAFAWLIGLSVGRIAPRRAVAGIVLGNVVGFVAGNAVLSASLGRSSAMAPVFAQVLLQSALWTAAGALVEIGIARYVASRRVRHGS